MTQTVIVYTIRERTDVCASENAAEKYRAGDIVIKCVKGSSKTVYVTGREAWL